MRYNFPVLARGAARTQHLFIPRRRVHYSQAGAAHRLGLVNALGKRNRAAKIQNGR
jgi:hypothetical protein